MGANLDSNLIASVAAAMEQIYENDPTLEVFAENHEILRTGMLAVAAKDSLIELSPKGIERIAAGAAELQALAGETGDSEDDEIQEDDEELEEEDDE